MSGDTQPVLRQPAYGTCSRCHSALGTTSYYFGLQGPLCEICDDQVRNHAIKADARKRKTWARWLYEQILGRW